jgi:hypothetical protein
LIEFQHTTAVLERSMAVSRQPVTKLCACNKTLHRY